MLSEQIVMEVRKVPKSDSGAVVEALEAVRRSVMNETGVCPSKVVSEKRRRQYYCIYVGGAEVHGVLWENLFWGGQF